MLQTLLSNKASGQQRQTYSSDAGTTGTAVFSVGNEGSWQEIVSQN